MGRHTIVGGGSVDNKREGDATEHIRSLVISTWCCHRQERGMKIGDSPFIHHLLSSSPSSVVHSYSFIFCDARSSSTPTASLVRSQVLMVCIFLLCFPDHHSEILSVISSQRFRNNIYVIPALPFE
jgi:hypothetical protein